MRLHVSSTVCSSSGGQNCMIKHLVSPPTECDDTRCCTIQFWLPDEHGVAQLVEALRYEPEGRGFDYRLCQWHIDILTYFFRPQYDPGFDSACNRNGYQEYFLVGKGGQCVGQRTLLRQLSWNLGASTFWNPQDLFRSVTLCTYV